MFALFWLTAAIAILWEWQRLVGGQRFWARVLGGTAGLIVLTASNSMHDGVLASIAALICFAGIEAWIVGPRRRLWATAGFLYAGLFLVSAVVLRRASLDGEQAILWLFATVWSTDVFAYLGGRLLGGPKIWPRVSPSKTWSGTLIGILAGAVLGSVWLLYGVHPAPPVAPLVLLSAAVALVSQAGDAFESALKRRFGVKDTSALVPGHGGVMDRLDGFVAAVVFAFLVGSWRDPSSPALGLFYWG